MKSFCRIHSVCDKRSYIELARR